ncbi:LysE family translocator [Methylovirgula sp. 4M-Z18]|uniref:LysE family translocator n=1 Tax=Methylovirgula sp. 4M-Z18 TaxID=2293567 RepID=UPI000E2EF496|nr:LysE family translocator [Methylovirgula sp. 4M-Z18]RFB79588.1 LysE family translocator [Methylovirgula sp. 4M-Z18]
MSATLLLLTAVAGFLYVVSPGPAFLAVFSLTAVEGRGAAARFVTGHLLGDTVWGTLALAAIIGASQIGAVVFEALGLACGLFLIWLGFKAIFHKAETKAAPVGQKRPLMTGVLFGLTNPKAYPVSVAMFGALVSGFANELHWFDAPYLMTSAFCGFIIADVVLVFCAGLPMVRRFFATHGSVITRAVGVIFVLFGAKSIADAAFSFARRA